MQNDQDNFVQNNQSAPYQNGATPYQNNAAPYQNGAAPYQNETVPYSNDSAPYQSQFVSAPVNGYPDPELEKKKRNCEIGFWLSITGVILAIFGISYGAIIYVLNICFAAGGLKTEKRGKAITTIILSILSVIITIIAVILKSNQY